MVPYFHGICLFDLVKVYVLYRVKSDLTHVFLVYAELLMQGLSQNFCSGATNPTLYPYHTSHHSLVWHEHDKKNHHSVEGHGALWLHPCVTLVVTIVALCVQLSWNLSMMLLKCRTVVIYSQCSSSIVRLVDCYHCYCIWRKTCHTLLLNIR